MTWGRRRLFGAVVVGVIATTLLGLAWLVGRPRHPMTTGQAIALVGRDVPLGSSTAQVTTWLDAQRIEHSPYQQNKAGGEVWAIIRDTHRSLWMTTDIQIVFSFDQHRRLTGRTVHEVFTGP